MSLVKTMTGNTNAGRLARHRPICLHTTGWRGGSAHPDAPAGGCGPGYSRSPGPLGYEPGHSHPCAPAGKFSPNGREHAKVEIEFGSNAKRSAVSNYTLQVLEHILQAAGEPGATITSTARSAEDQARAMFNNLEKYGVAHQKRLYGPAGDKVIDAYAAAKIANKRKEDTLADMEDTINEIGPSKVSNHAADPLSLGVIDVAPSSIWHKDKFIKAVQAEARVTRFLQPPADPAFHLEIPQRRVQIAPDAPVAPPPLPPKKPKEKTWVEFQVVLDGTGEPVSGLQLRITLPDGIENFHTTNSKGMIRVEDIDRGECEVKCELKGARLENTLKFVAAGDAKPGKESTESVSGFAHIAEVEEHKVKKGESIDNLAKQAGLTWQELALFNWGTDVPREINVHLRNQVGCTRKTDDGNNYVFDDSDEPGIVFIPRKWSAEALSTAKRHVFRVRPLLTDLIDLVIPLELDLDDDPEHNGEVRLCNDAGTYDSVVKSSDKGAVQDEQNPLILYRFTEVPAGVYEVLVKTGETWHGVLAGLRVSSSGVTYQGRPFNSNEEGEEFGHPEEEPELMEVEDEHECDCSH